MVRAVFFAIDATRVWGAGLIARSPLATRLARRSN